MKHTCEWKDGRRVGRASCAPCMVFETRLWDAINQYATTVGGNPSALIYGNTARMHAVAHVGDVIDKVLLAEWSTERVIADVVKSSEAASRHANDVQGAAASKTVYVTHVYDNANKLHDYYVHLLPKQAVRHAAADVVMGRFMHDVDPDFFEVELRRVIDAVTIEPGTNRRHVWCDSWRAHIDEMKVLV